MTERQFFWGLANGIIVLAIAGVFWFGMALGPYAAEAGWLLCTVVTLITFRTQGVHLAIDWSDRKCTFCSACTSFSCPTVLFHRNRRKCDISPGTFKFFWFSKLNVFWHRNGDNYVAICSLYSLPC